MRLRKVNYNKNLCAWPRGWGTAATDSAQMFGLGVASCTHVMTIQQQITIVQKL